MLVPGGRLDRRDDLPGHAELGKRAERRLLVGAEVAHGLVETDQTFLDQILGVAPGEEIRARFQPDERRIAADQRVQRDRAAVARLQDELQILKFSLNLLRSLWCGCGTDGHGKTPVIRSLFRRPSARCPPKPHP